MHILQKWVIHQVEYFISNKQFKFIFILLDVNVNALSAVAAKQIENARAPR